VDSTGSNQATGPPPVLAVAAYRFRATFRRRSSGYLAIVLLVGLMGGLAMGSVAAARRTASSFAVYLANTNPSDLVGVTAVLNPGIAPDVGYNPALIKSISGLPHVKRVASSPGLDIAPLQPNGAPYPQFASAGNGNGSVNGEYFVQDRVTVIRGHMADPHKADEFMLSAVAAADLNLHVGQTVPIGVYTNAQTQLPAFGSPSIRPYRIIRGTLVATVVFSNAIVQDDTDVGGDVSTVFTPALTRELLTCCVNYTGTAVQVDQPGNVATVSSAIQRLLPRGVPAGAFVATSVSTTKAQRAIQPEAIALGVFGGIVALGALLIAGQLIGRQLRLNARELETVRALGASPLMTETDGLVGIVGSIVVGALLAVAVAVSLSPFAPLGPVRFVYPDRGVVFDWTVLGFGLLIIVLVLSALTVVFAYRGAPHRVDHRLAVPRRGSGMARIAASAGMPVATIVGARFALEPGAGRNTVPVRSAILGSVMAMIVVVGTVTFGASLNALVSNPPLYGWNWDYAFDSGAYSGDIPSQQAARLLHADHDVAAWSGAYFSAVVIDGRPVQVMGQQPGASVQPPILAGHGLQASDQIVLGASTLTQLGKQIGQTVVVDNGGRMSRLRIVGTSVLPAIGQGQGGHLEMASGAVVSSSGDLITALQKNAFNDPLSGPNAIFVRLRPGVDRANALRGLNRIASATTNTSNFGVQVVAVERPAEIVNYRTLGTTPAILGAVLAAGALTALGLTLVASVRRRRRDLALLKALGFTRRQMAETVAWQSSVAVSIGIMVGVPLGIVVG
jgi:hypothetical protein